MSTAMGGTPRKSSAVWAFMAGLATLVLGGLIVFVLTRPGALLNPNPPPILAVRQSSPTRLECWIEFRRAILRRGSPILELGWNLRDADQT